MEFEAVKDKHGEIFIKPNIEKKDGNVIVHMPSLAQIENFRLKHGKRNIQQI